MQLLNEAVVLLNAEAKTAEEAIRLAGDLLVKAGKVRESYVNAMVKGFNEVGPYIVIAPGIAAPHARPEHGVIEKCLSFVRLQEPVKFGHPTNDPVQIICAIGGVDSSGHIEMLQYLASILGDPDKIKQILTVKNYKEFIKLIE
ncbi:MAG: PTS sugar transporter subunit IIA [Desulfitobacteriaceae bacterium]